jgi:hypothetical protein
MGEGDHSNCPIELVMCPEHLAQFHRWVRENHGEAELLDLPSDADEKIEAAVGQLETYGAACLWCGHGYEDYSRKAEDEHFVYHCPDAPEELRENARRRLLHGDDEHDEDSCASAEEPGSDEETR